MANATNNRREIAMPFLQIRYLKCNERVAGLFVAVTGLIVSIWANCIVVTACLQDHYGENTVDLIIVKSAQLSHFLIALAGVTGLHWGFKENNRNYLTPWMCTKGLEGVSLFVGSIPLITGRYIGLLPVGIIFLLITGYITMCVWDTYKKMPVTPAPSLENISVNDVEPSLLPDKPPSYDSFTNQSA